MRAQRRHPDRQITSGRVCAALLLAALVFLAGARPAPAQESTDDPLERRSFAALAGVGNGFGGFGVQTELYVSGDRLSVFTGVGYAPSDRFQLDGIAGALGVRGYTAGNHHRGFLDVSLSLLMFEDIRVRDPFFGVLQQEGGMKYGPGLTAGYQLTTGFGLTAMLSGGLGVAVGLDDRLDESPVAAMLNLGLGYTFR